MEVSLGGSLASTSRQNLTNSLLNEEVDHFLDVFLWGTATDQM